MNGKLSATDIAASLAPLLKDKAEAGEKLGALAPEILSAFRRHNLFGLYVPEALGGLGLGATEALELIEAISYKDGSSGWVLMAAGFVTGVSMAYMPDETMARIFAPGRTPVLAGTGAPPPGKAVVRDGGFLLSGKWSYGSGIKHADYILAVAIVIEKDAPRLTPRGLPETRLFIVPREQISFGENWDVIGLRATGSIDYRMNNVFVPENFTYLNTAQDSKRGALFRLGYINLVPIGHSAFAIGIARRLLDEVAAFARGKTAPGGIGASESFQEDFARHEAALRGARAFLMETWRDVEATVGDGRDASTRQQSLIRLALNHVTTVATDIAVFAYRAAGGTSLREGILQRCARDMLAGAQHMTSAPFVLRGSGKELAGLAPGHVWAGLALIDPAPQRQTQ